MHCGSYRCRLGRVEAGPPRVVNGLGIRRRKPGDGTNANEVTSQRLTDPGPRLTFYDCLVQVEVDDPPNRSPPRRFACPPPLGGPRQRPG